MSISDKVISANPVARQTVTVDGVRFNYVQHGANHIIAVGNTNLFLFDNSADCAVWVNTLNGALQPALSALRSYYDSKVSNILA